MLTLFTTPKAFREHFAIIQRNAIQSWTLLRPACEIILFGDDEGVADIATEFGLIHIPKVACNEYGTPLVSDMFEQAQRLATYDSLCYINADIILMSDFMQAVEQVTLLKYHFLMVGQRWDVELRETLDFQLDWEASLRSYVSQNGHLHPTTGIDYFVFWRGFCNEMPPFVIGRPGWDNWFIFQARSLKAPVIDATEVVMAVHQNHDYSHRKVGRESVMHGPEAEQNLQLAVPQAQGFSILDATHSLTPTGLKRVFKAWHLQQRLYSWLALYPRFRLPVQLLLKIIEISYPLRAWMGLTKVKVTR
jgi:hypothetical protein